MMVLKIGLYIIEKLFLKNDSFEILDDVRGQNNHDFEYFIHFSPNIECELKDKCLIIKDLMEINFNLVKAVKIELLNSELYEGAWRSIAYNQKDPIKVFRIRGT